MSPSDFIPFSKPCIDQATIDAVCEVLASGWITTGPKCAQFESDFKDYTGTGHCIALSSATAGMHLLLKALNIGPGDEVITPAMTWVSTVNLIALCGAKPVFVDIDQNSLMTSAELIEPLVTSRTKLIIPVHFAGAAVDMDPIREMAAKKNIFVVEDAAHALGTSYKGDLIGKKGTSIFSLHPIKNITCGEGGLFCTDNAELADKIRRLKFHGLGVDAYDRKSQGRAPQAEVIEPGFKYNLPDILAVIGVHQLGRLEEFNDARRELALRYQRKLTSVPGIQPLHISKEYDQNHSWHLYIVRVDEQTCKIDRNKFMAELKKMGIGTGLHFKAVHIQKYYRQSMPQAEGTLTATEWNSDRIMSLPLFPDMTKKDQDRVIAALHAVLDKARG